MIILVGRAKSGRESLARALSDHGLRIVRWHDPAFDILTAASPVLQVKAGASHYPTGGQADLRRLLKRYNYGWIREWTNLQVLLNRVTGELERRWSIPSSHLSQHASYDDVVVPDLPLRLLSREPFTNARVFLMRILYQAPPKLPVVPEREIILPWYGKTAVLDSVLEHKVVPELLTNVSR